MKAKSTNEAKPGACAAPLQGIRIADFSWAWAGPYCSLQLAFMGAEVIKVESSHHLDMYRLAGPFKEGTSGPDAGGGLHLYNQGKRSVTLNLNTPEGVALARQLVAQSDVVIENMAAGVMDRIGLGYRDLAAVRPDIIMLSMSAFGATGPMKDNPAFGVALVFMSGLAAVTGYPGGDPGYVGVTYPDPNAGLHGATSVLSALWYRERTGRGQHIDLSQWEATLAVLAEPLLERSVRGTDVLPMGNRDPICAPQGCFPCQGTDEWVSIAVTTDTEWRTLAEAIGHTDLGLDPRFVTNSRRKENEDELEAILTAWTLPRTKWEITEQLQRRGIAAFPSMTTRDLVEDPHLNARGFFAELDHPTIGRHNLPGVGWQMSRTPYTRLRSGPILGEDNQYVLEELLGLSGQNIDELIAERVVF